MARAIIAGLITNGTDPQTITVVAPSQATRASLEDDFAVITSDDHKAAQNAQCVILAVKPQIMATVADQITSKVDLSNKLIISLAAGITLSRLEELFGDCAITRTMPNTPARIGLGATGIFPNERTTESQLETVTAITDAFGISVVVETEELLESVTAISGSGPAYFFLMLEEMIRCGQELGLSPEQATSLTLQTALGAASMAQSQQTDPQTLRRQVTSPGGATHAAITSMQESGFSELITKALNACRSRSIELGKN